MIGLHDAIYPQTVARLGNLEGLKIREDVLYTDSQGREKSRARRTAEKQLGKLAPALAPFLAADEVVLYAASAIDPLSKFERFFASWLTYAMHKAVMVFTNKRLLHLGVDSRGRWKRMIRAVAWSNVQFGVAKGGLLSKRLDFRYANGQTESYLRLSSASARKLKPLLKSLVSPAVVPSGQGMQSLCPTCRNPLVAAVYTCSHCGQVFKDEATLRRRALLPGGGYFYVGEPGAGVLVGLFEILVVLAIVVRCVALAAGTLPHAQIPDVEAAIAYELIVLAAEKMLTYHHASVMVRGFLPAKLVRAAAAGAGGS